MKIKKLELVDFRHIKNQTIQFGENLTVIAGQNSTGKSSILGWVAQAFNYKGKEKTINNKNYYAEYSEVFRFCEEKDYEKRYEVNLIHFDGFEENKKGMTTRTMQVTEQNKKVRFRVDFDRNYSKGNKRAINYPVVYLGLKRLIPLATEGNILSSEVKLEKEELEEFSKTAKEILILLDNQILPESVKSKNKEFLAMATKNYSHLGNSAGQDNIGQIITAILSLKRLKKGGLLLIDEIDATLYAGSQIKLVEYLYKISKKNSFQIVFTTHSLEIIEYLSEKFSKEKMDKQVENPVVINFLEIKDSCVENLVNPPFQRLRNRIKVQTQQKDKVEKIKILCEDELGKAWCQNLIKGCDVEKDIEIHGLGNHFGEGDLVKMSEAKHVFFKEIKYVLDGDCKEKYKKKKPPKTLFLPGNKRPENVFYEFLLNLSDKDDFWDDKIDFTKQVCFNGYQNAKEKEDYKNWFNQNTSMKYFGERYYSKLLNKWKELNKEQVEVFQKDFIKIIYEK